MNPGDGTEKTFSTKGERFCWSISKFCLPNKGELINIQKNT